ncbi:MAG: hypothetical protein LBH60_05495 [Prevotellaceae bacterium]|nr:hypothetical protein [Prevotellaceae bacterium]
MESIENMNFLEESSKTLLRENCIQHIFSWKFHEIENTEYYKRFIDWLELKKYQENKLPIDKYLKNKMLSDFYKKQFLMVTVANGDLSLLINKFTDDDLKIVLAMKILNSQVYQYIMGKYYSHIILSCCFYFYFNLNQ